VKFKIFFMVVLIGFMISCGKAPTVEEEALMLKRAMANEEPIGIFKGKIIEFRSLEPLNWQIAILEIHYFSNWDRLREVLVSSDMVSFLKKGDEVYFSVIGIESGAVGLIHPSFIVPEDKVQEMMARGIELHEPYEPYKK